MGLRHALWTLVEQWDDIRKRLGHNAFDDLVELVTEFVDEAADEDISAEIAYDIARLLSKALPDDHPFRRALAASETRLATGDQAHADKERADWSRLSETLRGCLARPAPGTDPPPTPDEVMRRASEWLLEAAALSEEELRAHGQDPDDPDLIRLDRDDGSGQWPAFQFGPDGAPLGLVRTINRILDVADDPWGVADWWLGENGWLSDAPVRLMGRVDDQLLIDAAHAEDAEA